MKTSTPKIAVLLAVFNGRQWLMQQIDSILTQADVDVTLFVSIDPSSDGSENLLRQIASSDPRVVLMPLGQRFGRAGANFYRLLQDNDLSGFDYTAFSDQDDIWDIHKLSRQVDLIRSTHADGASSNVIAFWPDGRRQLIVKSQPQKTFDFLFESAGQGCTYLMSPWLAWQLQHELKTNPVARQVEMHDWLAYAICRAHGRKWVIDSSPLVEYRQHQHNAFGVNVGWCAVLVRLQKIKRGWYRQQVALIASVAAKICAEHRLQTFERIIQRQSFMNQVRLVSYAIQGRRKLVDRLFLILTIVLFIF